MMGPPAPWSRPLSRSRISPDAPFPIRRPANGHPVGRFHDRSRPAGRFQPRRPVGGTGSRGPGGTPDFPGRAAPAVRIIQLRRPLRPAGQPRRQPVRRPYRPGGRGQRPAVLQARRDPGRCRFLCHPRPAGGGGKPLGSGERDSEGLAILGSWPGDGWVVSFERDHRLVRYPAALAGVAGKTLQGPPGIADLPLNSGLETVLALSDGTLLALAEDDAGEGRHKAWLGRSGDWKAFTYAARPPFLPVDAALLPGGDVLVLERRASWIGGWGSRLVRIAASDLSRAAATGGVVEGAELARLDPPLLVDNFEGIDVRPGKDGSLFIYLLSDDNFSILQRTLLLMFELPPG
ncbi:hypothetical protein HHL28_08330 [Aerophototrophica crusticola]|uniref:Phytase-like domain-containing protein n=2 Tax=Aerophototrophica crusticola TaxID=1709002 RepID=A0A858R6R1_9PROT|nr:hypothetical protein HHL28_08330 [Rhodospirillaceae bacterium B3]